MSCASSLSKRKENKIPIKSENKRKRKKNCSCPKCPITDRLIANNKNITFRQYVFSQFNRKPTPTSKPAKDKQADISRILYSFQA